MTGEPILTDSNHTLTSRPRAISFFPYVKVHRVLHIEDYSEEEIINAWYDPSDLQAIKSEIRQLLSQAKKNNSKIANKIIPNGLNPNASANAVDLRGLETRTKHGAQRKVKNRQQAQVIVLNCDADPETMPAAYAKCTKHCRQAAIAAGKEDAEVCQRMHAEFRTKMDTLLRRIRVHNDAASRKQQEQQIDNIKKPNSAKSNRTRAIGVRRDSSIPNLSCAAA